MDPTATVSRCLVNPLIPAGGAMRCFYKPISRETKHTVISYESFEGSKLDGWERKQLNQNKSIHTTDFAGEPRKASSCLPLLRAPGAGTYTSALLNPDLKNDYGSVSGESNPADTTCFSSGIDLDHLNHMEEDKKGKRATRMVCTRCMFDKHYCTAGVDQGY